jgi:2-desacetyl-2-hydroxyethyl bacteriochlorophyllide A dehydrogenase
MTATMRAVRLVTPGAPVQDAVVPVPPCGAHDVRVRVHAAGICHSDVHYRAGRSRVEPLPLTLGHEVAGVVEAVGVAVTTHAVGERVCLHYLVTCGACTECAAGREQFCPTGKMLGHFTDGGWAEALVVPARNAVPLPAGVSFAHGAVMMCSSATSLHALRKGRLARGEVALVIGAGGLGMSAIQLARLEGASRVLVVERDAGKRALAQRLGAEVVDPAGRAPQEVAAELRGRTDGRGVDVALELVGHGDTVQLALKALAPLGRAVVVGLNDVPVAVDSYRDLIGREGELIGSNDHLLGELHELVALAARGALQLHDVVTQVVPLEAAAVNAVLDALAAHRAPVRTVVEPFPGSALLR